MLVKRYIGIVVLSFASILQIGTCAHSAAYYVSTTGSDSNAGDISHPLANVATAIQKTVHGDTVYIRAGTYNQQIQPTSGGGTAGAGNGVTVQAYPGEAVTISGADRVTSWLDEGACAGGGELWEVTTGWVDQNGVPVDPQEIFVDGVPQQQIGLPAGLPLATTGDAAPAGFSSYAQFEYPAQVGSSYSDLASGRFFFDKGTDAHAPTADSNKIYLALPIGVNPNTHTVLVSRRSSLLSWPNSTPQYITFKNIAWRYSNYTATWDIGYAVGLNANDSLINCDVEWCDFGGVGMGQNCLVTGCVMSNNGDSGACASGSSGWIVTNCTMNYNNWRRFNPGWHAGGIKMVSGATYGRISNNMVVANHGIGIWLDTCSGGLNVINGNFVDRNGDNGSVAGQTPEGGIDIEATTGATIENNVVSNNTVRGIYLNGSNSCNVFNNTVAYNGVSGGTSSAIDVAVGTRSRTLENNTVTNNILYNNLSNIDIGMTVGPTSYGIYGNTADYNLCYRSNGVFANHTQVVDDPTYPSGQMAWTLAQWQGFGFDAHGKNANPLFYTGTGGNYDYSFPSTSPAYQAGNISVGLGFDFYSQPRTASSIDIGAIGYNSNSVYEAELGALTGGAAAYADTGCSNGARAGGLSNAGAAITWSNVNGGVGGLHNLTFAYSDAATFVKGLFVNGVKVASLTLPSTGSIGGIYQSTVTAAVTLNAGTTNTVAFKNDTNTGPDDIDKLDVGQAVTIYGASIGAVAGNAGIYVDAGCSGGFRVGGMSNPGASVTWSNVVVGAAGSHTFTIVYSDAATFNKGLYVNGTKVATLSLTNTGGVGSPHQRALQTTVTLSAGTNTIAIVNDTNTGPDDIDSIVVGN